ncbi:hypothetical protein [Iamia sp.]|uniref:hypothetical protein n=1 Tax=Iamia sp. TaxID=2722710 RepID=UPI002BFBC22E|nr:hypothetical protein [Iamia sp.]HXH58442.1 hypothetical protein [Iamia sp.]
MAARLLDDHLDDPGTWTLTLTGDRPMTMNSHRTLHPMVRAKVDKVYRQAFHTLARARKVPALQTIRLIITPLHKDGRSPQDVAACAPAAKAAVDGLVDAHVIPADTPVHVRQITFLAPRVCGVNGREIVVVDLSAGGVVT